MRTLLAFISHPLTSVIIGGAVTWLVAWIYYKRAGDELRREAILLGKASNVIISFLENSGADVQVRRDDEGRPIGLTVGSVGEASGSSTVEGVGDHVEPQS